METQDNWSKNEIFQHKYISQSDQRRNEGIGKVEMFDDKTLCKI